MARHRTIDRVAQILELVATTPEGMTLSEIAPVVGAPVSSVHVLLDGLVSAGYVDRVGARYILGPAPYILTLQAQQSPARLVTHGDLERLSAEGDFTVILGVRVGDDIVYIDEAGDDPLLQHIARTHMRRPTIEASAGWVLVAALEDHELHEYLRRHEHQDLVGIFLGELSSIRDTGVAYSIAHGFTPRGGPGNDTGVLATAVRDHTGRAVASIAIGKHPDYVATHFKEMAEVLIRHSQQWSARWSPADGVVGAAAI